MPTNGEAYNEAELALLMRQADPVDRVLLPFGAGVGQRLAVTLALT